MKKFYNHKLGISETNLQTIEWFEVVEKVLKLTSSSPQKHQLNALGIYFFSFLFSFLKIKKRNCKYHYAKRKLSHLHDK